MSGARVHSQIYKGLLAALLAGGAMVLAGCQPDQSSGETLLNACLEDQSRDGASYACNCYVAAINEELSDDDLNFYGVMARHGYYADRDRLQSVFEDEEYGVFERAASRCNLTLFQSGPGVVPPPPAHTVIPPSPAPLGPTSPGPVHPVLPARRE